MLRLCLETRWTRASSSDRWNLSRQLTSPESSWSRRADARFSLLLCVFSVSCVAGYISGIVKWPTFVIWPATVCSVDWSSVTLPAGGLGARTVGRPTFHGGPVVLRFIRATPCNGERWRGHELREVLMLVDTGSQWRRQHQQVLRRPDVAGTGQAGRDAQLRHVMTLS